MIVIFLCENLFFSFPKLLCIIGKIQSKMHKTNNLEFYTRQDLDSQRLNTLGWAQIRKLGFALQTKTCIALENFYQFMQTHFGYEELRLSK